jgi:hypothetical protein
MATEQASAGVDASESFATTALAAPRDTGQRHPPEPVATCGARSDRLWQRGLELSATPSTRVLVGPEIRLTSAWWSSAFA